MEHVRSWVWLRLYAISLLLSLIVYFQFLGSFFITDDLSELSHGSHAAGNTLLTLLEPMNNGFWRPVGRLVTFILAGIFGYPALPFHLVMIATHALCASLTGILALRLGAGNAGGYFVLCIYTVNFAAWGSVVQYMNLADLLVTVFLLLGLVIADRNIAAEWRPTGALYACFLLALGTKEVGVLFPFILALWIVGRQPGNWSVIGRLWPMFVVALVFAGILWHLQVATDSSYVHDRVSISPKSVVRQELDYFLSAVFPWIHLYDSPVKVPAFSHTVLWAIRGVVFLSLALAVVVPIMRRNTMGPSLLAIAMLCLLLPSLLETPPSARYLYSALPFLTLFLVATLVNRVSAKALLLLITPLLALHIVSFHTSPTVLSYHQMTRDAETFIVQAREESHYWEDRQRIAIFNHPHKAADPWRWAYAQQLFNLFIPDKQVIVQLDHTTEDTAAAYRYSGGILWRLPQSDP